MWERIWSVRDFRLASCELELHTKLLQRDDHILYRPSDTFCPETGRSGIGDHFERFFISINIFTQRFKELHPFLLFSIPFQTNKINIRLSDRPLLELIFYILEATPADGLKTNLHLDHSKHKQIIDWQNCLTITDSYVSRLRRLSGYNINALRPADIGSCAVSKYILRVWRWRRHGINTDLQIQRGE